VKTDPEVAEEEEEDSAEEAVVAEVAEGKK